MSYARLSSIAAGEIDSYILNFDTDEGVLTVKCVVHRTDGLAVVEPTPDVFMSGLVSARDVSAAVLAFDKVARATVRDGDQAVA